MGLGRVELPTSRLSGVRSNHLSYRPSQSPKTTAKARNRAGLRLHLNRRHSPLPSGNTSRPRLVPGLQITPPCSKTRDAPTSASADTSTPTGVAFFIREAFPHD